jgi:O-antigen ligase
VLSSFVAYQPSWAYEDWPLYLNWLILFFLVTHVVNTPRRTLLFWGLFMLWSLKMSQHGTRIFVMRGFTFSSWGATGAPGWFQNSGEFAIQMCIFLPMALHLVLGLRHTLPRWKLWGLLALLPGTALISLLASSSRGGQLGMVAVLVFMVGQTKRKVQGLAITAVVLVGLWQVLPAEQKDRFETMGDDGTSQTRLTYWEDGIEIMQENPALGIGFNNWLPYYHRFYNPVGELPHNIFVEAGSELGYTGLLGFVALIVATFVVNFRTRRLTQVIPDWGPMLRNMAYGLDGALIGFMVSGFFVTVLYYPFFWVNLAFTAALWETTRRAARKARRAAQANAAQQARVAAAAPRRPAAEGTAAARVRDTPGWVTG